MSQTKGDYPAQLRYTKEHEWVKVEGSVGIVGITHYAQSELGDVVFVDLPEKGKTLTAGDELGTIESVKAVSEIYAPVSGEVLEVNDTLKDHPEKVNADPYGEGWLLRVKISRAEEIQKLLDADGYRSHIGEGGD